MLANLPPPDPTPLKDAPLNLVVLSLNFAASKEFGAKMGTRWRAGLAKQGLDGRLSQVMQHQIQFPPVPGPSSPFKVRQGFQVSKGDEVSLALYADGLVIESRMYTDWAEFKTLLSLAVDIAMKQLGIEVVTALSLRYVNALSSDHAFSPSYWRERINPTFLGIAANDTLLTDFQQSFYSSRLSDGNLTAEVRVGIQPDAIFAKRFAFVFDIDLSDHEQYDFSPQEFLERTDSLNTVALKIFQNVVIYKHLKGGTND